ncbi:hypothetical protein V1264_016796 [Littorina saxatilis]|uniref:Uncharacterized protein n=2 Tax=Littorina saxatilis TaxID=31220 RepID=A0AAN9BFX0_9CAEN
MYQVTKVAKLLLALEKGDLATIRGKTLDDTTSQFPLTTFWMMKTTAIMMKRAPQPFRQHHSSNKSLDLALVLQGVHVMGILIINMLLIKDLALVLQGVHVMGILILNMLLIKDLALVLQGVHVMGILIINMFLIKDLALVLQGVHVMGILILNMLLIKDLALVLQGVHVMGILILNMLLIKGLWPEKRRRCHKLKLP